jgi:SET domain
VPAKAGERCFPATLSPPRDLSAEPEAENVKRFDTEAAPVEVVQVDGEYSLRATTAVPGGGRLFAIDGILTEQRSRFSVQVSSGLHVDLPGDHPHNGVSDRYFWRFTNHSCEPNTFFRNRTLRARRAIEPGEEISFDYHTTEYEMISPFDCRCGSARCLGTIRGFRFLPRPEQERLRPWLAPHLLARLDRQAPAEPLTRASS